MTKKRVDREFVQDERERLGITRDVERANEILERDQAKQFDIIVGCARRGSYLETACKVAGISRKRFYDWVALGNQGREPYLDFVMRLNKAQGEATMDSLSVIELAGARGDWRASAWRLERMYPELYGQKIELTKRPDYDPSAPEAVQTANLSRLGLGDLKQLASLMAKASGVDMDILDISTLPDTVDDD